MRPLLLLILTLVSSLQAVQWPAGTKAVIPFTANRTLVGESVPNFAYQVKIVTDTRFKSAFNSAANITIFDTTTGLQRPARIWYYTKDTIFAIFDGPATNSIDKAFHACAGPTINRVNSAQAFTNSGISNFWGFDESAGSTTVSDYAGGVNGTVVSPAVLGSGYLTSNTTGYANVGILPAIDGTSSVSAEGLVYIGSAPSTEIYLFRCRIGSYNHFQIRFTSTLIVVDIGSSDVSGYGYVTHSGKINLNSWNLFQIVYDGSQATNAGKLKLFINGSQYTLSFSGTIPTALGENSTTALHVGGGVGVNGMEKTGEVCIGNLVGTAGCFQTRSAMLLNPQTFWTQGASFGVGKSTNNNKNNLHIGISLF